MQRLVGVLLILFGWVRPSYGVPVMNNFSSGKLDSTTTSRQVINEVIVSEDFNTGWVHSVTGTGIKPTTGHINPTAITEITQTTTSGGTTTWTGLDLNTSPNWVLTDPGSSFQFTSSYQGPGLRQRTTITRTIETETSVTSSSVFSN